MDLCLPAPVLGMVLAFLAVNEVCKARMVNRLEVVSRVLERAQDHSPKLRKN